MIERLFLLATLLLATACRAGAPAGDADSIELVLAGEPGSQRVEARGLPAVSEPADGWPALFRLSVASVERAGGPAVVGRYELREDVLVFEPRFALEPELEYSAVLRRALLPGATGGEPDLVESLIVPRSEPAVAAVVEAVYPTARPLPANVLKFYVHFSRPMARGFVYEHAHVLDGEGEVVRQPFLELEEELWNPAGTRLTLLVDPGRIKRGLLLHEQMGAVFEPFRSYTLLVEAGWPGADGAVLASDLRVEFTTGAPDVVQPDPAGWVLELPTASSREPLVLALDEALDHALLERMLRIVGPDGSALAGNVMIADGETQWSFVPARPWSGGEHQLLVDVDLEDLAGNSVGRLFEVHLGEPTPAPLAASVRVAFRPVP